MPCRGVRRVSLRSALAPRRARRGGGASKCRGAPHTVDLPSATASTCEGKVALAGNKTRGGSSEKRGDSGSTSTFWDLDGPGLRL